MRLHYQNYKRTPRVKEQIQRDGQRWTSSVPPGRSLMMAKNQHKHSICLCGLTLALYHELTSDLSAHEVGQNATAEPTPSETGISAAVVFVFAPEHSHCKTILICITLETPAEKFPLNSPSLDNCSAVLISHYSSCSLFSCLQETQPSKGFRTRRQKQPVPRRPR